MFTGLIREVGVLRSLVPRGDGFVVTVEMPQTAPEAEHGDSISIDGACLTVTGKQGARVSMDAVPETIRRSTLGDRRPGDRVNVEPSLRVGDKMGGHWVLGHVDGTGTFVRRTPESDGELWTFTVPPDLIRFVVDKGSIAINGISLTIASWTPESVTISVIPTTLAETNLAGMRPGTRVNLEMDLIGKYVHRYVSGSAQPAVDGPALRKLGRYGVG